MLELTKYGQFALEKQGIYLTKTGQPKNVPKNSVNMKRSKNIYFEEENKEIVDQTVQKMSKKIFDLIKSYYTEPNGVLSKRGKKRELKIIKNYEEKENFGFLKGDRTKFWNLSNEIASVF